MDGKYLSTAIVIVGGMFSFVQWYVANQNERSKNLLEITQFYAKNIEVFQPCHPSYSRTINLIKVTSPELTSAFVTAADQAAAETCPNQAIRVAALQSIGSAQAASDTVTPAPAVSSDDRARQRVYIHYPSDVPARKTTAEAVQTALKAAGYQVMGIEGVATAPSANEIRTYQPTDQAKAQLIIQTAGPPMRGARVTDISRTFPNLPADVFEIWIGSQ